jgi:hypothetical protein
VKPAFNRLAHSVLGFLAEHLHLKFQERRVRKELSSTQAPAKGTQKRHDHTRLTDGQLEALVRMYLDSQRHNKNPDRSTPRITQQDIANWANETFGVNKDRKTYIKMIRDHLGENQK